MFYILCQDILLLILFNISDINDIVSLSFVNKNMNFTTDNNAYMNWGRFMYTNEFWDRAKKREPEVSRPLINMRMELLRIDRFQKNNIKHGFQLWTNEDFYKYWNNIEEQYRERISIKKNYTNKEIYAALEIL